MNYNPNKQIYNSKNSNERNTIRKTFNSMSFHYSNLQSNDNKKYDNSSSNYIQYKKLNSLIKCCKYTN